MKIPVFVSRPNRLSPEQELLKDGIYGLLSDLGLEPRTIGQSDHPTDVPMREVLAVGRRCAGGLILGLARTSANPEQPYPTPWNHLEAGVLFALRLPLLIWKEPGIEGGVFDNGVAGTFVHVIRDSFSVGDPGVRSIFAKWQTAVSTNYYSLD